MKKRLLRAFFLCLPLAALLSLCTSVEAKVTVDKETYYKWHVTMEVGDTYPCISPDVPLGATLKYYHWEVQEKDKADFYHCFANAPLSWGDRQPSFDLTATGVGECKFKVITYHTGRDGSDNRTYTFTVIPAAPASKVTFHPNGGELQGDASQKFRIGEPFGELPLPVRTGWYFAGWYDDPIGGKRVNDADDVPNKETLELYAHWSEFQELGRGVQIAFGGEHALLLTDDGNLWGWGRNSFGQVGADGVGDRLSVSERWKIQTLPVLVLNHVKSVSAGGEFSVALRDDGTVWTWGKNDRAQLGDGTTSNHQEPKQIMSGAAAVAAGWEFAAALKEDGTVWTWGYNQYGQLGNGKAIAAGQKSPACVEGLSNVKEISAGSASMAALCDDGSLWTWGRNNCGQLGDGSTTDSYVPVRVLDNVISVSMGSGNGAAIRADNSLYRWGIVERWDAEKGAVWNEEAKHKDFNYQTAPTRILEGVDSVILRGGGVYASATYAVYPDNSLWKWLDESPVMRQVAAFGLTFTSTPTYTAFGVIKTDGSLWMWGSNRYGQLGNGSIYDVQEPFQLTSGKSLVNPGEQTVPVSGVSLDKDELSLRVGTSQTLAASVFPADATNQSVAWRSSDVSVATVSPSGEVSAKATGTARITVETADGGKSAVCIVSVWEFIPVSGVSLNKTELSLTVGASEKLTVSVVPENASNPTAVWRSLDASIATVDGGLVTATGVGETRILVSAGTKFATCAVTVKEEEILPTSVSLNKTALSLTVGESETLIASTLPENASKDSLVWVSMNSSVATVKNGVVTAIAPGKAAILVSIGKTVSLSAKNYATCGVTVTEAPASEELRIDEISILDNRGQVLSEIPKGSFFAAVSITNCPPGTPPVVFLTAYSANGKFCGASVAEAQEGDVIVTLSIDNSAGRIANLKAFVASAHDGLKVIGAPAVFPPLR